MNLQEINAWLSNPSKDYRVGLQIYDQYKVNNKFDDYFHSVEDPGENDMHFKLLVKNVRDIHRKLLTNPALIKTQTIVVKQIDTDDLKKKSGHRSPNAANRPRIVENPIINPKDLPEDLQKLYFENKNLTKKLSVKHAEMADMDQAEKNNEKRRQLADEICLMDDTRTANWNQIDTWWKDNKLKTDDEKENFNASKQEVLKTARRIETIKINISRAEKELKKNPDRKNKLDPKIKKWKEELTGLEQKLK